MGIHTGAIGCIHVVSNTRLTFRNQYAYCNLPIKRLWALEIHGPKNGGGRLHGEANCTYNAYTHGP